MPHERRVIALASSAHFLTHMNMLIFPAVVVPFAREQGLDIAEVFPLGFMMYLLYGALALPAGYLSDHWSRAGILRICMAGMGVSSIFAGMAGGVAWFTVSLAMIGLFCGLYHPAGLGLIAHEIEKQGAAHGINGIFGNMGIAAAPFLTGAVLLVSDWRWVFMISGAMSLAGVAASYAYPVRETGRHDAADAPVSKNGGRDHLLYFGVLCAAMTIGGFTYRANMTVLPAYFESRAGALIRWIGTLAPEGALNASSGAAALVVGSVFLFSIIGQYYGGKAADRMDLRRAYTLFIAASFPFVAAMPLIGGAALYVAAAGFVFFGLGMQPIENSLLPKFIPRKWLSTGYGIKFTLTFGLGSLAVHQVALIEKWRGLEWVYAALTAQVALMLALALVLAAVSRDMKLAANSAGKTARTRPPE